MNPVLIETLWNVKIYSKRLAGYLLRINRNIVECKAVNSVSGIAADFSINRNIVECKGELLTVLKKSEKRINRNIVECKAGRMGYSTRPASVLIETLWNVKGRNKLAGQR